MKRFMKKVGMAIGTLGIVGTVVSGCGSENTKQTVSNENATQELQEISVMVFDRGVAMPEGAGTLTDNRWTKWVNEEMAKQGISVKYVSIPRSEETAKVPVLMASGSAPDVTYHYTSQNVKKFYEDGGIYNLNEYLEQYGQDILKNIGEEALIDGRTVDGDQYAIMSKRGIRDKFNGFIRKDWLDKLGLEVPTTMEELYEVLLAFKTEDPGNIGSENVIPYWPGYLTQYSFLKSVTPESYFKIGLNHWKYADEGYVDSLRWQNKLYNEGLIHPEFFADNGSQKLKESIVNGSLGYFEQNFGYDVLATYGSLNQSLSQNIPGAELIPILPMENVNDGEVYNPRYQASGVSAFVPKTCKNPEAAVKYMNFLAGYGGMALTYGFEGEHYELEDGVPVTIDASYAQTSEGWLPTDMATLFTLPEEEALIATSKSLGDYADNYMLDHEMASAGILLNDSAAKVSEVSEQQTNCNKLHAEYRIKLITCSPEEFDKIYQDFQDKLAKAGLQEIFDAREAYYNTMNQ